MSEIFEGLVFVGDLGKLGCEVLEGGFCGFEFALVIVHVEFRLERLGG